LRQSRTFHTLANGPKSGVQFRRRNRQPPLRLARVGANTYNPSDSFQRQSGRLRHLPRKATKNRSRRPQSFRHQAERNLIRSSALRVGFSSEKSGLVSRPALHIVSPFRQVFDGRLALIMLVFDIAKENFCAGNRTGRSNKTCTVTVVAVSHRGFVYLGHARLAAHPSDASRAAFVEFDEARLHSIG
jgi:hypothetical protein